MGRNLYLHTKPLDEALVLYLNKVAITRKEESIAVKNALHRILTKPVYAVLCSPLFDCAAMDGIAVISKQTIGASETTPLQLVEGTDYIEVDTGDPILAPYDAVIMAEDCLVHMERVVEIVAAAHPFQHVRSVGEDIVAHEMLFPSGHCLRPMDIGVCIAAGIKDVMVVKKPKVAIIPTGSEIVEGNHELQIGDIIESNSWMFGGMVEEAGGEFIRFDIVPDDKLSIQAAIQKGVATCDLVLINAGSSAGRDDYTKEVIASLGEVIVHGVAIKPGKPVILGHVNQIPVVGIPGYPVSAYIVMETIVKELLYRSSKQAPPVDVWVEALVSKRIVSSLKHHEFVRVRLGYVKERWIATPLQRGAGAATSLSQCDGFLEIPQNREGYEQNEWARVRVVKPLEQLQSTIVCIGSHDLMLDVCDDILGSQQQMRLNSSHVGSLSGLFALQHNECHIAPIHILDEISGTYNTTIVNQVFQRPMACIKGVKRIQGLLLPKDNPLNIQSLNEAVQYRFVNRQKGSGTRILLDYLLRKEGCDAQSIQGYEHEVATHMGVAAAVKNGSADVGLGVYAAAKALDLCFLPIAEEDYDFIVEVALIHTPQIQTFLTTLTSNRFQKQVHDLGGYRFDQAGEVRILEGLSSTRNQLSSGFTNRPL